MSLIAFLALVLVIILVLSLVDTIPFARDSPSLRWALRTVVIAVLIFLILEFFGFAAPHYVRKW